MTYHHPSYKAGYKNDSPSYALSTAGDVAATADYMVKSDLPGYTSRFYSSSEQEQFADIKYDKLLVNYDKEFEKIREAVQGLPIEAYIPRSFAMIEGGSSPTPVEIVKKPSKDIAKEIEKAQKDIKAKEIIIRDTVIEQFILRRYRKREIIAKRPGVKKKR